MGTRLGRAGRGKREAGEKTATDGLPCTQEMPFTGLISSLPRFLGQKVLPTRALTTEQESVGTTGCGVGGTWKVLISAALQHPF